MKPSFTLTSTAAAALALLGLVSVPAQAQIVINDTLTGAHSSFNWVARGGACLTAGDNSNTPSDGTQYTPSTPSLTIPACITTSGTKLSYYSTNNSVNSTLIGGTTGLLPDAVGSGALRLTNGDTTTGSNGNNETGAVISNFTFPTNQGVQVTWTSVTYGGNAYKNNASYSASYTATKNGTCTTSCTVTGTVTSSSAFPTTATTCGSNGSTSGTGYTCTYSNATTPLSGADGMTFFLAAGTPPGSPAGNLDTTTALSGGNGGSMGYSCSNGNGVYDGAYGYLGVGMDEFGNFSNAGDNTSSGASTGQTPGAIVVRGAGSTRWNWLQATYPTYYGAPGTNSTNAKAAVQNTCKTGNLYNYSGSNVNVTVPSYNTGSYTANYSCNSCSPKTGSVTSTSSIPSSGKCNSSGTPSGSGSYTCTYTNIQAVTSTTQSVASGSPIPSSVTSGAYQQLAYNYPYLKGSTLPAGTTLFSQEAAGTSNSTTGASNAIRSNATPITYALKITANGLLDFSYSVNGGATNTVLSGYNITANNGPLPSSFRFGFTAGTGGGSNIHEITCFKAAPADTSDSSASSNVQQSAQVQAGSQVFLAYYHPVNWWGTLTANSLTYNTTTNTLTAASTATWDANCVLTGGTCTSTNSTVTATAQGSSARVVLSSSGNGSSLGVPFTAAGLTSAQLTALGDTSSSAPEVAYLRGDRTNEFGGSGTNAYRPRTGVLGDIVDSSPAWVGYPGSSYSGTWKDKLNSGATMNETGYATFKSNNATRLNVVYVGANDGMLHGFEAGSYAAPVGSAAPVFSSTGNDGKEVLAYVPAQVAATIHSSNASLDYSNSSYVHNFFVDATPGTGDLYYGSAWHTWVVGGLGAGGHAGGAVDDNTAAVGAPVGSLFALDVTDPTQFSEANASTLVIGDWSSSSITGCVNSPTTACGAYLGQTLGTPLIRRLHDGTWAVLFGNGTNSATAGSGLFILHVASDGSKTFQYISAGTSAASGIVQIASADLDGDHVADYVYAGDVLGNLYRFDLTSSDPSKWSSMLLFQTASGQPITTAPIVASVPGAGAGSKPKVIVSFGTGQKLPLTTSSAEIYATGTQALYGIWDANMAAWDATTTDTQYAYLAQTNATTPIAITAGTSMLVQQTVTASTSTTRTVSNNAVCWSGSTVCASGNTQMGWYLNLPTSTEQVIYSPTISSGDFYVNTTIPATSSALTCGTTPISGWTMGISVTNGGAGSVPAFGDGSSGYALNGVGTGSFYTAGNTNFYGTSTAGTSGTGGRFATKNLNRQPTTGSRLTWTKVR